jgi:hypothetical protein
MSGKALLDHFPSLLKHGIAAAPALGADAVRHLELAQRLAPIQKRGVPN